MIMQLGRVATVLNVFFKCVLLLTVTLNKRLTVTMVGAAQLVRASSLTPKSGGFISLSIHRLWVQSRLRPVQEATEADGLSLGCDLSDP